MAQIPSTSDLYLYTLVVYNRVESSSPPDKAEVMSGRGWSFVVFLRLLFLSVVSAQDTVFREQHFAYDEDLAKLSLVSPSTGYFSSE